MRTTDVTRTPAALAEAGGTRGRRRSWGASALMGLALVAGMLAVGGVVIGPASSASAATVAQCNSVDNTAGLGIECDITVANHLDMATGVGSSTVTVTECHGAANTAPSSCTGPTTTNYTALTTSVSQCNSVLDGGGSSLHCAIHVVNTIVGASTATAATINQCAGSLGGGEVVLRACSPDGVTTTGATITQCNGTANGGTSSLTCAIDPGSTESAELQVLIDQCNSAANGGGSLVVCTVGMTTTIVPASTEGTGDSGDTGGTGGTGGTGDTGGTTGTGDTGTGDTTSGADTTGGTNGTTMDVSARAPAASVLDRLATTGASTVMLAPAGGAVLAGALLLVVLRIRSRRTSH